MSEAWLRVLDRVAKQTLGRDDRNGAALAEDVARISRAYTQERDTADWTRVPRGDKALAARLRFFLVRDWQKSALPIAEAARRSWFGDRTHLRVLDLGAGLGATSLGALAALKRVTNVKSVDLLATDDDAEPLRVLSTLVNELANDEQTRADLPEIKLETRTSDFFNALARQSEPFDLILGGFVWNELAKNARVDELLTGIDRSLASDGLFVLLEPALFETTTALEALRDQFVASERFSAIAPCTHDEPCPMRAANQHDWCHASLPLALPESLVAVARGAGLRYERLSFSYVALGKRGHAAQHAAALNMRIVSDLLGSKGKTEVLACSDAGLVRHRLLDREISSKNEAFSLLTRGDLVSLSAPDARIRSDVTLTQAPRAWPAE